MGRSPAEFGDRAARGLQKTVAIDVAAVFFFVGAVIVGFGVAMLLPALVDLIDNNLDYAVFLTSAGISVFTGLSLCEANRVDYVFGLARNGWLEQRLAAALAEAHRIGHATGRPARVFRDFLWSTRDSWSRRRRVIGKPSGPAARPTLASSSPR